MKICTACKYYRREWFVDRDFARCGASISLATGRPRQYCGTERNPGFDSINLCGSTGKLWEPRKSLWIRIKEWLAV